MLVYRRIGPVVLRDGEVSGKQVAEIALGIEQSLADVALDGRDAGQ